MVASFAFISLLLTRAGSSKAMAGLAYPLDVVADGPEDDSTLLLQMDSELRGSVTNGCLGAPCSTTDDAPYCIAFYYTSFCPQSLGFIREQLPTFVEDHGFNAELAFVPYGYMMDEAPEWPKKLKSSGRKCMHGAGECYSNALQRCALDALGKLSGSRGKRCKAAGVKEPFGSFQRPGSPFLKFLQCHSHEIKTRGDALKYHTAVHAHALLYKPEDSKGDGEESHHMDMSHGTESGEVNEDEMADVKMNEADINAAGRSCFNEQPRAIAEKWTSVRNCARAAYNAKDDDEDYKLTGEVTAVGAAEWLPMIRFRCPGEQGDLTHATRLSERLAEGTRTAYNFTEWMADTCTSKHR